MTKSRHIRPRGRPWTEDEIETVRRDYPDGDVALIASELNRSVLSVYQRAQILGLRKSDAAVAANRRREAERLMTAGASHRFQKGLKPWNTGLKGLQVGGRAKETQFKKGQLSGKAAQHLMPVGSHRVNTDGYLDRKVRNDGPAQKRWVAVHRLIWIEANGTIPAGHAVSFKPGRRTNALEAITLDALELVSRRDLMRRNSYHNNYPKELGRLIQLRGAVQRQINRRERIAREKQD